MKNDSSHYITKLQSLLEANADQVYASSMKKYMRNQFEFLGISSPRRKELFRTYVRENGWPETEEMEQVCRDLYLNRHREYHYYAIEMIDRNIKRFNEASVKLFEYMIVTNAWWDTVDFIAANILGKFFKRYPGLISEVTEKWMNSGNIWLQRSCILFQLKYKKNTDLPLLYSFIQILRTSDEFFIQKAIGWILREYSKSDPKEIQAYSGRTDLKPLSRREALRIINKK